MPDDLRAQRDRTSLVWFLLLSAAINGAAIVSGYWIRLPEAPVKPDTVIELTDLDTNDVEKLGQPDASQEASLPEPEPTPPVTDEPIPPPLEKPEFEVPEPTPPPEPSPTPAPSVIPKPTPVPRPLATPKPPPLKPQAPVEKPREQHPPNPIAAAPPGAIPGPRGNPAGAPNGTGHAGHPSGGAVLLRSPKPPYPPQALQMGIRGDVRVQFTVSNGNIVDVRAISGPPILSSAVVRWTRANWKFAPGANGTFTLPVTFEMR